MKKLKVTPEMGLSTYLSDECMEKNKTNYYQNKIDQGENLKFLHVYEFLTPPSFPITQK